ncbi:hypothetical protein E4U55_007836 [Claviceps digitariae]|nr:hypothetical protein E4U55_007836 [Claviceps digitariae]
MLLAAALVVLAVRAPGLPAAAAAAVPMIRSVPVFAPALTPVYLPSAGLMQNLVTFGDSYTDEGRLDYIEQHGKPPPQGAMLPPSNNTASGGAVWARFVANTTGASLYNYAVRGAMCSNDIDSRTINYLGMPSSPFPDVLQYEMNTYRNDISLNDHRHHLYPHGRHPDNTLYALWIGTNDVGIDGFLGDHNKPNTTLTTFIECTWRVLDAIYLSGGRHFLLLNLPPLSLAPMYAAPGESGTGNHGYWNNRTTYSVEQYANKLDEYVSSINTMWRYGAGFYAPADGTTTTHQQQQQQQRWPGASLSIFDIHALMMDVVAEPGEYLDEPANVRAPYRVCLGDCVESEKPKTSFMWYDELHPSERMHTIFAKHFIDVVQGRSKYGLYYR